MECGVRERHDFVVGPISVEATTKKHMGWPPVVMPRSPTLRSWGATRSLGMGGGIHAPTPWSLVSRLRRACGPPTSSGLCWAEVEMTEASMESGGGRSCAGDGGLPWTMPRVDSHRLTQ